MGCLRFETLEEGAVVRILLDRPKANILDAEMIAALRGLLAELQDRAGLRLLIFEGAGRHFSFGASVEEHLPDRFQAMLRDFHGFFRDLEVLGVPTAAVVRGQCLGGGFELATWCGRVFADETATFALPEVKLAVFPPIGALALSWRVGGSQATDLVLTGRPVPAREALELGVCDAVSDDPLGACLAWYETRLQNLSPTGLRNAWRAVRAPLRRGLRDHLGELEAFYAEGMDHPDPLEGLTAFLERRRPTWRDA